MGIPPRYRYGELRLSRIEMIYRYDPTLRLRYLHRGYAPAPEIYRTFLQQNFAWLFVVFADMSIILAALQMSLAADGGTTDALQRVAFGFATFSVILPLGIAGIFLLMSGCLVVYNISITLRHAKANARPVDEFGFMIIA